MIYCPKNVWVIRFNGFNADPDEEALSVVCTTKKAAMKSVKELADALKERYPEYWWFEEIEDRGAETTGFICAAVENERVFVEAKKAPFTTVSYITAGLIKKQENKKY